jgi:plastocyanin
MKTTLVFLAAVGLVCFGQAAVAENHVVDQLDKAFSQTSITIKVGDSVEFRNSDPFFHNVFSLSDTKFFDLGSYPKGESKTVVFDTAGSIHVECSIHPEMQMDIEVVE